MRAVMDIIDFVTISYNIPTEHVEEEEENND